MKILPLFLLPLPIALAQAEPDTDMQPMIEEARQVIQPFKQDLLHTVKQAIEQGGPIQGVQSCKLQAPTLTAEHSRTPWQVRRTALKVRNPDNSPDDWELSVLNDFSRRLAAGEAPGQVWQAAVIDGRFRYMQAIPTGPACLQCHGEALDPALVSVLDNLYPQDQARGFKLGELRGAFSLSHELNP